MTHYDTLNLKPNATEKEIKASFRKLAAKYHPDKNNGNKQSEEKFKQINEAYQILSDPTEKKNYDDQLNGRNFNFNSNRANTGRKGNSNYSDSFNGNYSNFEDIFKHAFNRSNSKNSNDGGSSFNPFEGFYDGFEEQQNKATFSLNLSFWDAALGCKKTIAVPEQILAGNMKTNIKIEAGTENNSIISVKVKGVEFTIQLNVDNDPSFSREGLNIYTNFDIPMTTALLGGKILFKHWTKEVEVTIPEGIKQGQKLRLKDLGIHKGHQKGHLFLNINILMPKNLTEKQKQLLQDFEIIEKNK